MEPPCLLASFPLALGNRVLWGDAPRAGGRQPPAPQPWSRPVRPELCAPALLGPDAILGPCPGPRGKACQLGCGRHRAHCCWRKDRGQWGPQWAPGPGWQHASQGGRAEGGGV